MPTLWWNCIGRCKDQDNTTDSNITVPEHSRKWKTQLEGEVVAKEVKVADDVIKAKVTESVKEIAEMINLEEAEVIVSGGRGMGSKEKLSH